MAGYGEYESKARDHAVRFTKYCYSIPSIFCSLLFVVAKASWLKIRLTQRAIKHALTERWYSWEDAQKVYNRGNWKPADSSEQMVEVRIFSSTLFRWLTLVGLFRGQRGRATCRCSCSERRMNKHIHYPWYQALESKNGLFPSAK